MAHGMQQHVTHHTQCHRYGTAPNALHFRQHQNLRPPNQCHQLGIWHSSDPTRGMAKTKQFLAGLDTYHGWYEVVDKRHASNVCADLSTFLSSLSIHSRHTSCVTPLTNSTCGTACLYSARKPNPPHRPGQQAQGALLPRSTTLVAVLCSAPSNPPVMLKSRAFPRGWPHLPMPCRPPLLTA